LDLRFADSKSLTDAVSGQNLITFTRALSGTYVGSDGLIKTALANAPRFDHDPETGESLGLLIEEQRTNYHLYSESAEEASAFSGKTNCTVSPNAVISPDGLTTGDTIVVTSTASSDLRVSRLAPTGATTNTFSVFAKAGTNSYCALILRDRDNAANSVALECNIANGTVSVPPENNGSATGATGDIVPYGNGWYRIYISGLVGGTGGVTYIVTQRTVSGSNSAVAGSTIHLWGAQMEVGAFPTSYIKNVDTPGGVTRNADVATITGSNFSSWYRQDEGTVFADAYREFAVPSGFFPHVFDARNTNSDVIQIAYNTESLGTGYSRTSGVDQAVLFPTGLSGVRRRRATFAYRTDDFAACVNGGTVVTDNSGTPSSVINQAAVGGQVGSTSFNLNGTISRLTFFPQRLPDATLQAITSP
jgi:hypothetical protein